MKIVVVSDTHGDCLSLQKVYLKEQNAAIFLHAGDSEAPNEEIAPFVGVLGNCDCFFSSYPKFRKINTPYGYLWIQHHPVSSAIKFEELEKEGVKILIHGHTHRKNVEKIGNLYVFCPGSLLYPRDSDIGSYLVLDVDEVQIQYQFKTL